MRDPELVARAQRAAARLESAWEQWRALHGLAIAPGQPVVSYVGYSLTEPWGEPRVVVGLDADEAEFLADYLDRDDCAAIMPGPQAPGTAPAPAMTVLPGQQVLVPEQPLAPEGEYSSATLLTIPVAFSDGAIGGSGANAGVAGGTGRGPDDLTAEYAAWSSGELPVQAAEQFPGWPPGQPSAGT